MGANEFTVNLWWNESTIFLYSHFPTIYSEWGFQLWTELYNHDKLISTQELQNVEQLNKKNKHSKLGNNNERKTIERISQFIPFLSFSLNSKLLTGLIFKITAPSVLLTTFFSMKSVGNIVGNDKAFYKISRKKFCDYKLSKRNAYFPLGKS